jgi:hypothetical protein
VIGAATLEPIDELASVRPLGVPELKWKHEPAAAYELLSLRAE